MTFAAGNGTFLGFDMTLLALLVICHSQSGLAALRLQGVAFGTGLTFGTFAFNFFSIFINMMTNGAVFGLRFLIVSVVVKRTDRTLQFPESINLQV